MEAAIALGEHLRQWRIMLGLSQNLAAARADISIPTLRRIERGETGVHLGSVLALMNILGLSERLDDATDPLNTELGKLRAPLLGRQRARKQS